MGSINTVKIYHNVLSDEERISILNNFKHLLCETERSPGLQTYSDLHSLSLDNFNIFEKIKKRIQINRKIQKSWINYTDINFAYEFWHNHDNLDTYDYSCCYMIENPENLGTWFRVNDEICQTKCPTNSVLVFHKLLMHTVPPNITKPRYSLAIDFY